MPISDISAPTMHFQLYKAQSGLSVSVPKRTANHMKEQDKDNLLFKKYFMIWSGGGGKKKSYHGKHQPQMYTREVKSTLCMNCRWQIPNSDSVTHDIGNSAFDLILADKLTTELKINSGYGTSCNFLYFNWLHLSNINETECREFVYALCTLK